MELHRRRARARLLAARVLCASGLAAWMALGQRWPDGSPVLGPLDLVWHGMDSFGTVVLVGGSMLLLGAFLIRPHPITACLSCFGVMNWWFWCAAVAGAGC